MYSVVYCFADPKRRRNDLQPIRSDLADLLCPWLAGKHYGEPLFPVASDHTAEMIRRDLYAAQVVYADAAGRVADFHSLRHTFITMLAKSSAPVKVVQTLARHSTPTLTLGTYSHIGIFDQSAALAALPGLDSNPPPESETASATGTAGRIIARNPAHYLPTEGDGSGRNVAGADVSGPTGIGPDTSLAMGRNPLHPKGVDAPSRLLSVRVTAEGERIRTPGTLTGSAVFKTAPIDHSGTPPGLKMKRRARLIGRLPR